MRSVVEISKDIEAREGAGMAFHTKNWNAAKSAYNFEIGSTEHKEFEDRNKELAGLETELAAAKTAAKIGEQYASGAAAKAMADAERVPVGAPNGFKTLGERFTESPAFKAAVDAKTIGPGFSMEIGSVSVDQAVHATAAKAIAAKTAYTLTTDATNGGYAPFSPRTPIVVPYAQIPVVLQDLVVTTPYDYPSVLWMEETLVDHQADIVPETNSKPQSTYKWSPRNVPMVVVAHWVHISRQQLEDVPMLQTLIDNELMNGLKLKVQDKMLNGTGGNSDIDGILGKTGIQTQAKGSEDPFSAIYHSFTKIRGITPGIGFAEPNVVVMNPINWDKIATTQDSTGRFIYGDPSGPVEPRIWGKRVVSTTSIAAGTALSGDFSWDRLWEKYGIRIEVGTINDDFTKNQLVILAECRLCQTITRPSAFCTVTGLVSASLS